MLSRWSQEETSALVGIWGGIMISPTHCIINYAVPGANKRDIRSIEETLKDIKSKKKAKLSVEEHDHHGND